MVDQQQQQQHSSSTSSTAAATAAAAATHIDATPTTAGAAEQRGKHEQKGLRDRNSPTCTLSQNGYGDSVGMKQMHSMQICMTNANNHLLPSAWICDNRIHMATLLSSHRQSEPLDQGLQRLGEVFLSWPPVHDNKRNRKKS